MCLGKCELGPGSWLKQREFEISGSNTLIQAPAIGIDIISKLIEFLKEKNMIFYACFLLHHIFSINVPQNQLENMYSKWKCIGVTKSQKKNNTYY